MSERSKANAKKVECLTKEEELLFEVIQNAMEGDGLSEDYKYLCDDINFTKKFAIFYEILKHTLMNSLDESSRIHFVRQLYGTSDALENYVSYRTYDKLGIKESTLMFYFDQLCALITVVYICIEFVDDYDIYDIINETFIKIRENELD